MTIYEVCMTYVMKYSNLSMYYVILHHRFRFPSQIGPGGDGTTSKDGFTFRTSITARTVEPLVIDQHERSKMTIKDDEQRKRTGTSAKKYQSPQTHRTRQFDTLNPQRQTINNQDQHQHQHSIKGQLATEKNKLYSKHICEGTTRSDKTVSLVSCFVREFPTTKNH